VLIEQLFEKQLRTVILPPRILYGMHPVTIYRALILSGALQDAPNLQCINFTFPTLRKAIGWLTIHCASAWLHVTSADGESGI